MFKKILIANRGEIACRIIATARKMGIATVAVYSDADQNALHVKMAHEAVWIGTSPASDSYLKSDRILKAAKSTKAEAIHPGYGFLSENADFARAVESSGLVFIGPSADVIEQMGQKDRAKALMHDAGVPIVPGYHGADQALKTLSKEAAIIGFPVLIKARAGGGGKGMRLVERAADFDDALSACQREALASFGDDHVLIEKYIINPRHIEVQVFGDSHGNAVHLFERDCSMQRRYQKVIEEAPAPGMTPEVRTAITNAAVQAAIQIGYQNAGTVEFIVDGSNGLRTDGFWFMEMNTRLQVEHPVTEAVTGTDLVEWQLRVAAGEPLPMNQDQIKLNGHAAEVRIYAEDPANDFMPAPGPLKTLQLPDSIRVDTGVQQQDAVSAFYDPMIAKLISFGANRKEALDKLDTGLKNSLIHGTQSNIGFLRSLVNDVNFRAANLDTGLIDREIGTLTKSDPDMFEAAALAMVLTGSDPNHPLTGFRLFSPPNVKLEIMCANSLRTIDVYFGDQTIDVSFDGTNQTFSSVTVQGNQFSATQNGARRQAKVQRIENRAFVSTETRSFHIDLPDQLATTDSNSNNDQQISAPITGVVTKVHVKNGQTAAQGTLLLAVEAMKMEHQITSPKDTKIAKVLCEEGASVSQGDILITFQDNPS